MKFSSYKIRLIISVSVFALSVLAIYGVFYGVKFLNLQFTSVLGSTFFDFSLAAFFILLGVVIITFLFGRFYCAALCPFGILQEIFMLATGTKTAKSLREMILGKESSKKSCTLAKNIPFKYFIAALGFGALIGGSSLIIRHTDPYTIFGSAFSISAFGLIVTGLILLLVFFKKRFFCTNICPVGAVLGLISKFSLNKICIDKSKCVSCGLCAKNCPSGCIDIENSKVDNETCVKCLKCTSLCKKDAIKYGMAAKNTIATPENPAPAGNTGINFSLKRRKLIIAGAVLLTFGGAIKGGIELSKNFAKKLRGIILPPGALDTNRMANKCLNCNLCIENCPNKILNKASDNAPFIHIDYSKGKGYCKFDCTECSKTCPAGAIKRISLDEKQKTRIAMAIINPEKCTECGLCITECPTGALFQEEGKTKLDGTKCIGCGKCRAACRFEAIEIYAVNEQKII